MKKFLAVLMSAILLLAILAGCGNETPDTTEGTNPVATPIAAGMLVLNANGTVNISYDADGLVLDIEGADDNGSILVGEYTDFLGKSCSEVICDLIGNSIVLGHMDQDVLCVMIKQAVGSALPGSTFLETIQKDAEAAIAAGNSKAKVILLTEENLDEQGYINLESAKALMLAYLGLETFDTLDGTIAPINGLYGFSVIAGDLEGDYIVDAVTGGVFEGTLDGVETDEDLDEEFVEPDATEDVTAEDPTVEQVVETTAAVEPE